MSLIAGHETPIILFASRPLASRKGLGTLLDALLILNELSGIPAYGLWIVGGSDQEREILYRLSLVHPSLSKLLQAGRLLIWGHVESEGMAELYSRSVVTVVPSTFEQFGLVAVEAMACGCPVIASRTGGLQDTIVEGLTGEFVPVDCAQSLANVLTGYLRNPQRSVWQGANGRWWVRSRFATERVYDRFFNLLSHRTPADFPPSDESVAACWRENLIRSAIPAIEGLMRERVLDAKDVSDRTQTSARVVTAGGVAHVKILRTRPPTMSIIYPLPPRYRAPVQFGEIIERYRVFVDSELTPRLLHACETNGLVITQWAEPVDAPDQGMCEALMRGVARFGEGKSDPALRIAFQVALERVAREGSLESVNEFDHASAMLNRSLNGGVFRFQRTHPQVEILRLVQHLEQPTWSLPGRIMARMSSVSKTFLAAHPIVLGVPQLAHGSLKPAHVLREYGKIVACDLDNSLYAVGPLDLIHWQHSDGRIHQRPMVEALQELRGLLPDDDEFVLGAAWLLVYVLHRVLDRTLKGSPDGADRFCDYLLGFTEGAFASGLIP